MWEGLQLGISDSALRGFYRARVFSDSLFPGPKSRDPQVIFHLTPYEDQGLEPGSVATIQLSIGNQQLKYNMGKQKPHQFTWPPASDLSETALELEIIPHSKGSYLWEKPYHAKGLWGWFRLLQQGQINEAEDLVTWDYNSDKGTPRRIQYGIRVQPNGKLGVNPFAPNFFKMTHLECLPEVGAIQSDASQFGRDL